ncbi:MAG: MtrB/PioB family outer membrane beta-barrel protein [Proteobacteria bacterium]|nr:MtrB/PioB family outer membrane beta-barrel protein [Pseudomonadota bacterium]MBU1056937.1 MtrB/PioB family outer membrane beta-barrel protein [Pseudomonadota bacterium]
MSKADSNHYVYFAGSGTPAQTADPTLEDGNDSSYHWTQDIDDAFWTYRLTTQFPIIGEKLHMILSWEYQNSDGESNFTTEGTSALEGIDLSDDYTMKTLEAKAIYAFSEKLDFTIGYIYEKYEYEDLQYEG